REGSDQLDPSGLSPADGLEDQQDIVEGQSHRGGDGEPRGQPVPQTEQKFDVNHAERLGNEGVTEELDDADPEALARAAGGWTGQRSCPAGGVDPASTLERQVGEVHRSEVTGDQPAEL